MALRSIKKYSATTKIIKKDGYDLVMKPEYKYIKNAIFEMPYGAKRRKIILDMLREGVEFKVNGMHDIQTKNDPDIKRLLKCKKIEMFNVRSGSWSDRSKHTYLRIKNG